MIELPEFSGNVHIKITFLISLSAGNTISKFNTGQKLQNFPGFAAIPRSPNYIWDKANLFPNTSLFSDSYQYVTFYKSLANADFFNLWDRR